MLKNWKIKFHDGTEYKVKNIEHLFEAIKEAEKKDAQKYGVPHTRKVAVSFINF